MSLASTSSEPSPEPLFDLHDSHGQAALHVAARLGQAQVVKVFRTQNLSVSGLCKLKKYTKNNKSAKNFVSQYIYNGIHEKNSLIIPEYFYLKNISKPTFLKQKAT